jgi:predicted transcriptional regulator
MPKTKQLSNAQRFVNAYNTIDQALRARHNIRRSLSFSDMIRRTVAVDYIVRKYEDILIDYGRLRNAIIHKSNDQFIIAEPHDDVVVEFEKIAYLVSAPLRVWDTVCTKDVVTVDSKMSLKEVMKLIYKSTYSNLPIYKNGGVIGVANGQKILDYLGKKLSEGAEIATLIENTTIEQAISEDTSGHVNFVVKDMELTVEEALNLFYQNRKLLMIMLTKSGSLDEAPIGILTPTDIMDLNKVLD